MTAKNEEVRRPAAQKAAPEGMKACTGVHKEASNPNQSTSLGGLIVYTGYCMDHERAAVIQTGACTSETVAVRNLISVAAEVALFRCYERENGVDEAEIGQKIGPVVMRYYLDEKKS